MPSDSAAASVGRVGAAIGDAISVGTAVGAMATATVAVGAATSRIYEDAGEGYDYRRGVWRTTFINQTPNTLRFTRTGSYNAARTLTTVEFVGVPAKPKAVLIDGREAKDVSFDQDERRLRVPRLGQNVNEIVIVP